MRSSLSWANEQGAGKGNLSAEGRHIHHHGIELGVADRVHVVGHDLLLGIDEEEAEIIGALAADTDTFWSDGLQPLLEDAAGDGDLSAGVLASLGLWRENVLVALSDDFGIELDWGSVTIDTDSPLIDALVEAATPAES